MPLFTGSSKFILGGVEETNKKETVFYGLVQKNVLITGSNGQLGNELRERKSHKHDSLNFIYTDYDVLDITNLQQVEDFVKDNQIQYIINCAAYTAVDKAESDKEKAVLVNVNGPENLAIAAKKYNAKLVHISTDYVFDGNGTRPYTEDLPKNPQSVYGITKADAEDAILKQLPDAIIIRTSWLYSEFGNNFVKTMLRLMNERTDLNIVADQLGSPTYAADLAEMIVHILNQYETDGVWKGGIYHFSNSGETTWYDFTAKIKELSENSTCALHPITTDQYPTAASRPKYSVMDTSKIQRTFNVHIPGWEESLLRMLGKLITKN